MKPGIDFREGIKVWKQIELKERLQTDPSRSNCQIHYTHKYLITYYDLATKRPILSS